MAIARFWFTVTPAGKASAQAAIDVAGLGGEVEDASWEPYPSPEDIQLYWTGANYEVDIVEALEAALDTVPAVARHRRGPPRASGPAMSEATLLGAFPEPNSGPEPLVVVTKNAALAAHYRDFGLGPLPDDGSPGLAPSAVETSAAPAERKRAS